MLLSWPLFKTDCCALLSILLHAWLNMACGLPLRFELVLSVPCKAEWLSCLQICCFVAGWPKRTFSLSSGISVSRTDTIGGDLHWRNRRGGFLAHSLKSR